MFLLRLSILLTLLIVANTTHANSCYHLFSKYHSTPYLQIYAGQTVVGKDYALYKELRDAGIDPFLKIEELSSKQKKALTESILEDLADPTPAVRDPTGRFFLLDGHHSIYAATLLFPNTSQIEVNLDLVYDSLETKISWTDFEQMAIKKSWFYTPTAKDILTQPKHIHVLENSVDRSMLGLFFIAVEEKYGVPMKGKYFQPFVQFYLADLIKNQKIWIFSEKVDFNEIPMLRKTLLHNRQVIDYLISQLRPEAPKELRDFLHDL